MSNLFNLKIAEYNHKELEDLLSLQFPYTKDDVLVCGQKMKASLFKDPSLKTSDKDKVVHFIESATEQLSDGLMNNVLEPKLKKSEVAESGGHMIIKPPNPDPGSTWKGVINPLSMEVRSVIGTDGAGGATIVKTINIDSAFRKNYFSTKATDFHITLNTTLKNVVQMRVAGCELPQSIYAISTAFGNNFFSIQWVTAAPATHFASIVIPDGNYEGAEMQDALNTQLNQPVSVTPPGGTGGAIQATFDKKTGKIVIAANAAAIPAVTLITLSFNLLRASDNLDDTPIQMKLGWALGYRFGSYSGNTAYVTEGIYDFRGPRYLYLVVNDYNNNYNETIIGNFNDSITAPENILARLPWKQYAFFSEELDPLNTTKTMRNYFGPVNISRLHIQILDPFGRVISLNNMDWALVLEFSSLYKV